MGYYRAGFDVIGVDIKPQRHYPFPFIRGDALKPPVRLDRFDAIHASPPCQAFTSLRTMWNAKPHADRVSETRALLVSSGLPFVIENVRGAPLRAAIMLCGTAFGLGAGDADLRRHRWFETDWGTAMTPPCNHGARCIGVYGGHGRDRRRAKTIGVYGGGHVTGLHRRERGERSFTAAEQREAMGIDWMTVDELSEAIPPVYTEFIGGQLLEVVRARSAS